MRKKERPPAIDDELFARRDVWSAVPGGRSRWGRRRDGATSESGGSEPSAPDVASLSPNADASTARANWADQLDRYVEQQGAMDALRLRPRSEAPWPQGENPMVGYLIERGSEMAAEVGFDRALDWLATNAWFEGVIAERVRIAHLLDDE